LLALTCGLRVMIPPFQRAQFKYKAQYLAILI
jgi:hypothetical protein